MFSGLLTFAGFAGWIALTVVIYLRTRRVRAAIAAFIAILLILLLLPGVLGIKRLDLMKHPAAILVLWIPSILFAPIFSPSEEVIREAKTNELVKKEVLKEMREEMQNVAEMKASREKPEEPIETAKRMIDEGKYREAVEFLWTLPASPERMQYINLCANKLGEQKESILGVCDAYVDKEAEKLKSTEEIYQAAAELYQEKKYSDAAQGFGLIRGYQDANELYIKASLPALAQNGGTLFFGTFPQWFEKESQEIEWVGIPGSKTGAKDCVLLVSRYALKVLPFHEEKVEVSWAGCSLRTWLNHEFYDTFTDREKKMISKTPLRGFRDEAETEHDAKLDTEDNLFVLSPQEEKEYLGDGGAKLTPRAQKEANPKVLTPKTCSGGRSWLRKTWEQGKTGAVLHEDGVITTSIYSVNRDDIGIRPAMFVKLPDDAIPAGAKMY